MIRQKGLKFLSPSVNRVHDRGAKAASWIQKHSQGKQELWYELARVIEDLKYDRCLELLAIAVTRVATVLDQDHAQSLLSLKRMNVPVSVVWALEKWILSEDYSILRKRMGTKNRVKLSSVYKDMAIKELSSL